VIIRFLRNASGGHDSVLARGSTVTHLLSLDGGCEVKSPRPVFHILYWHHLAYVASPRSCLGEGIGCG
jgi:hypothetical protein